MSTNCFTSELRRWNRECTGYEPSMSVLQKGADDAADLIDELSLALRAIVKSGVALTSEQRLWAENALKRTEMPEPFAWRQQG